MNIFKYYQPKRNNTYEAKGSLDTPKVNIVMII